MLRVGVLLQQIPKAPPVRDMGPRVSTKAESFGPGGPPPDTVPQGCPWDSSLVRSCCNINPNKKPPPQCTGGGQMAYEACCGTPAYGGIPGGR